MRRSQGGWNALCAQGSGAAFFSSGRGPGGSQKGGDGECAWDRGIRRRCQKGGRQDGGAGREGKAAEGLPDPADSGGDSPLPPERPQGAEASWECEFYISGPSGGAPAAGPGYEGHLRLRRGGLSCRFPGTLPCAHCHGPESPGGVWGAAVYSLRGEYQGGAGSGGGMPEGERGQAAEHVPGV